MHAATTIKRLLQEENSFVIRQLSIGLLCHVEKYEAHVFVGNSSAYSHVSQDGSHHARRKFPWGRMATAAVGAIALLTLDAHRIGIIIMRDWNTSGAFASRRSLGMD